MDKKYICLDIGGTKVLGAVFDEQDNIVMKVKKKTKAEKGMEQIEEKIISVVEELINEAKIGKDELGAIGAGAPGVINEDTGEIIYAPNLPWRNYDIKSKIEDKFNVPFYLGNEANVGMIGEWKYGAAVKRENVVGIFIGTGVGGGLIINNKLFSGPKHLAGELGHMVLNTEGPYCNCGQRGCFEAYASKVAITRDLKLQIERGRKTILKDLIEPDMSIIKSKALKKAVDEKDEVALEIMDRAVYYMAAGTGSGAKLDAGQIGCMRHGAAERIDFLHQMPFANTADGGVATHLAQGFDIVGQQQRAHTTAGSRQRGFSASVTTTNDDHIVMLRLFQDFIHIRMLVETARCSATVDSCDGF
jgi:glucokinase